MLFFYDPPVSNLTHFSTFSSLVAFGPRNRSIGESAKTQETSNFRNTVGSLKRLIGRSANDPDVTDIESKFLNAELVDAQGTVGVKVSSSYFHSPFNPH
jgi:heat shock protein 4